MSSIHRLGEIRDCKFEKQKRRAAGLDLIFDAIIVSSTRAPALSKPCAKPSPLTRLNRYLYHIDMAILDNLANAEPAGGEDAAFYASRRTMIWARRSISPGLRLLLWSLRLYVVLMLWVVAIELFRILK